jgi:hypothetical protein
VNLMRLSDVPAGSESLSLLRSAGAASATTIAKTATTRPMDSQLRIPCRGSSIRLFRHPKRIVAGAVAA